MASHTEVVRHGREPGQELRIDCHGPGYNALRDRLVEIMQLCFCVRAPNLVLRLAWLRFGPRIGEARLGLVSWSISNSWLAWLIPVSPKN